VNSTLLFCFIMGLFYIMIKYKDYSIIAVFQVLVIKTLPDFTILIFCRITVV
jgi:hypothetical protein